MGIEWPVVTLGELIENKKAFLQTGPFGTALKASEYSKSGVPLISVREIRNGFIQIGNETPRVDEYTTNRLPKFVLKKGDIVFGRKGGIDRNALVTNIEDGWFLGSDGIFLRLADSDDAEFISYVLHSRATKAWLIQNCEGTTMPSLNQKILSRLPVYYPPSSEKKKVSLILRHLNQKITLNKKTNQTLEQMAQTLFKNWFVDFDPVFDNALLKAGIPVQEPSSNENDQQLFASFPETLRPKAKLRLNALRSKQKQGVPTQKHGNEAFPSEFEFDEKLGWIPKGWVVLGLSEISKVSSGKRPPSKSTEMNDIENIPVWGGNGIKWYTSKALFTSKFIITGRVGTLGTVYKVFEPSWISDNALILEPKENSFFEFVYQCLLNFDINSLNSGSTQPLVTQTALKSIEVIFPNSLKLLEKFQTLCSSFDEKSNLINQEVEQLTKLRDTLLPKLISGELQIPVAEQLVKEMA
jgi:type I restriction enzyme S subunit